MYRKLQKKNRKAWSSHCCLATSPFPHQAILTKISAENDEGMGDGPYHGMASRALGTLAGTKDTQHRIEDVGFPHYEQVQCIPLFTLVKALGRDHVDLVSLDVEDAEMGVLKGFPWGKITVDVWMVEHRLKDEHWDDNSHADPDFIAW
ncbi:unnamed protein product, partial [Meganyctiphanes norvegica]